MAGPLQVGDIITILQTSWGVYQAFSDGPKNAGREFAEFKTSYGLLKHNVEKIHELLGSENQESSEMVAKGFKATAEECARFIRKHELLTRNFCDSEHALNGRGNPMTINERARWVFRTVKWHVERDDARLLKRKLDDWVQAAMLEAHIREVQTSKDIKDTQQKVFKAVEYAACSYYQSS